MRRLPNGTFYFLLLVIVFAFLPALIQAQPWDACAGIPDPGCDPNDNGPNCVCPIDGGLSALIALGVGYGIKKVRDVRRENGAA